MAHKGWYAIKKNNQPTNNFIQEYESVETL